MLPAENTARYVKSLYPLGVMLAVIPLIDWTAKVSPFFPDQLQWRFGAEVALVATLGIVLTGFALIGGIAAYSGHRLLLRVLSVIAGLGAVLAVLLLGFFLLDTTQMRGGMTDDDLRAGLTKALISGSATAFMGGIVLASLALGMWRASAGRKDVGRENEDALLIRKRANPV
jgi:hypothetical protein